jgi:hypothetical protein
MPKLRLDCFHRLTLSIQQRCMCVTEFVPRNTGHFCGLTRGIENSPKQVVRVVRSALFVGKYQRVGMRLTSLLLSVLL